jgi:hypothetical protein
MKCKYCNEPAEWLDQYCQMHWEAYCDEAWWKMMMSLEKAGLLEEASNA